jgi:hypothetical protein
MNTYYVAILLCKLKTNVICLNKILLLASTGIEFSVLWTLYEMKWCKWYDTQISFPQILTFFHLNHQNSIISVII